MKKLIQLLSALMLLAGIAACSEKDDNPNDASVYGYKLDQFIDAAEVRAAVDSTAEESDEFRGLFAYQIVSSVDGFSPRDSQYAGYDLPWETFMGGYLVPSDSYRTWFPDADLPGAFKVRDTGIFRLYRKVDVNCGVRGSKMIELHGLSKYPTPNWIGGTEDAIRLSDLLQGIAAYDSVLLMAFDGYSRVYSPEQVNDGYYLLDSEVSTFPSFNDGWPNSLKKFKKLSSVEVYGATSDQNHEFELAPTDAADLTFTVPADLSGFESTVMPTQ